MAQVDEFGSSLLSSLGVKVGVRSKISTYTEVVCKNRATDIKDRPDGLIVVRTGSREWRTLVETKIGSNELNAPQIEKYRQLAKDNDINCVISISNQFATSPSVHPLVEINKSRSKISVFHWSWMFMLTEADLLLSQNAVSDMDQKLLLNELRRFLTHESAGLKGFDRMPKEWGELNKLVSSSGVIPAKSTVAPVVVSAWHQETRDLVLILTRMTETNVTEKLSRKQRPDGSLRLKDELVILRERHQLLSELEIPDAAAALEIKADLNRCSVDVGMTLRAPEDKVSTKARVNWLLHQVKTEKLDELYLRLFWPGKAEPTQHLVSEIKENADIVSELRDHLTPHSFHIYRSKRLGSRFTQQANFILDLEALVPSFYREVGSSLSAWLRSAPKIKEDRSSAGDVSTEALSDDAKDYEG